MQETPLEEIQRYFPNVVYPTRREVVLETAQRNGAPGSVLQRLEMLRSRVSGPHEVLIALREGGWSVRDNRPTSGAPPG